MTEFEPDESELLRYIRNIASEEENVWVDNWLIQHKENDQFLQQIAKIYYAWQAQERISERDSYKAYNQIEKLIKRRSRKIVWNPVYVAAACCIGILLVSSLVLLQRKEVVLLEKQLVTVQANAGMRTHLNLPDGTVVYLNSGSSLSYPIPYDEDKRSVTLEGEAFFKVKHDSERPFVVSVAEDRMRVKVLGTEFNLEAYKNEERVQTTLVTGSVNLEMKNKSGQIREHKLLPSERATYDFIAGKIEVETVNAQNEIAWIEGKLIFKDTPLPEVLKELSYFYNVKFEVKDTVIENYCFTGIFIDKQLSQVLDYIKISSEIGYNIEQQTNDDSSGVKYSTITLWKKR